MKGHVNCRKKKLESGKEMQYFAKYQKHEP